MPESETKDFTASINMSVCVHFPSPTFCGGDAMGPDGWCASVSGPRNTELEHQLLYSRHLASFLFGPEGDIVSFLKVAHWKYT